MTKLKKKERMICCHLLYLLVHFILSIKIPKHFVLVSITVCVFRGFKVQRFGNLVASKFFCV